MTTDDDMREIEAALTDFAGNAIAMDTQWLPERDKLLALIRQKLPQTDAEHERAVEAWRRNAMGCPYSGDTYLRIVSIKDIDEALRLMRARPAIEPHTFTGLPETTYEKLVAKEKAAGELLRAAIAWRKIPQTGREQEERETDLLRAIEAFERAGVR